MTDNTFLSPESNSTEQSNNFLKQGFLSTFILKLIAIISMTIDHVAVGLGTDFNEERGTTFLSGFMTYDTYNMFRYIGRIAFPIFCYLIAQGLLYTKDVKKYAARLLVFAIISQVPFSLLSNKIPLYLDGGLNVYFTLFIGLVVIAAIHHLKSHENPANYIMLRVSYFLIILAGAILADLIKTDYGSFGVILIVTFYLLNQNPLICCGVVFCLIFFLYGGVEKYAVFALIPILLHNHKKGPSMKYFFYAYYPVHMLVIYILYTIIL